MKINFVPENVPELEIGDFIKFNGYLYMVVKAKEPVNVMKGSTKLELIGMNSSSVYNHDTFEHPIHIINHINKHFGKGRYLIIKADKVELNVKE